MPCEVEIFKVEITKLAHSGKEYTAAAAATYYCSGAN